MSFMCDSMLRSGSSQRFRIDMLCVIVSAPTVIVTLFKKYGLPLNISHSVLSLFNFSPLCAI